MIYIHAIFVTFMLTILHLATASENEPAVCYVCNTFTDENCERGNLSPKHLKNCSDFKMGSKYTACRIIEQNVDFKMLNMEPNSRIIRQCSEWDGARPCYYRGGFGGRVNVCHCKGEGCNSADIPKSIIFTIFLSLAFTLRVLL
uniref:Hypothetical secreted protein n=1 Tax=Hottentotta judaicus TaxID=6863 RepID=F1CJ09_HOTJU|nr:hypothetical secreted protein [Hottentotta judaicus]